MDGAASRAVREAPNPPRTVFLFGLGILTSMLLLALIPTLLHQTSFRKSEETTSSARLIPLTPEEIVPPGEVVDPPAPEPPPPEPELPEPRPEDLIDPPVLAEPPPPEIAMPEIEPPRPTVDPVGPTPLPMETPRIESPALPSLSLSSLPVHSRPVRMNTDLRVAIKPVKASLPAALPAPEPAPKPSGGPALPAGAVDQPPRAISTIHPVYPFRARRLSIEGRVTVRLLVDAGGKIASFDIVTADPEGVFEQTVSKTVPNWRFEPALKDGRPVETWVTMDIVFQL